MNMVATKFKDERMQRPRILKRGLVRGLGDEEI
jgi:hypothetical protein